MAIDIIRPGGSRAVHMVRPNTQMVIREGRVVDGHATEYSAMGVCGTEAKGSIVQTEQAADVTCQRCNARAVRALTPPEPMVGGSHGWDAAPVLSSPEAVAEPPEPPRRDSRSEGAKRHGRIRYERSERRRKMKEELKA